MAKRKIFEYRYGWSLPSHSRPEGIEITQTVLIESIFTRPPIFDNIFSGLSPSSLIRFGRTCHLARNAVSVFSKRAFNINRRLSRYFSNPIAFRSLQARTGTLISGSSALQLLDRTFYPESDLDLYAHPGHSKEVGLWLVQKEGYTFIPTASQENPDFEHLDESSWTPWATTWPRTDIVWEDMHIESYRVSGVDDVYSFEKPPQSGDGPPLRVQIVATENSPLQCILGFHSTCVMNFIAFDAAYSIYPRATFEKRRALSFTRLTERDIRALGKYALRGWSVQCNIWPHEVAASQALFYMNYKRWVKDSLSWVVPLDMTGVEPRPSLSPVSEPFAWDPVVQNSWVIVKPPITEKIYVSYHILKPTLFRYTYLVADRLLIHSMGNFFKDQGKLEHAKTATISNDKKEASWTWWDAILPGFIADFRGINTM